MSLRRPTAMAVGDQTQLLNILVGFYDAILELRKPVQPGDAPNLKAITRATFADMRAAAGDINGELGPRVAMVAGKNTPMDGSQGVFAWDPTSQLADNNTTVLQVSGVATGRWRRVV